MTFILIAIYLALKLLLRITLYIRMCIVIMKSRFKPLFKIEVVLLAEPSNFMLKLLRVFRLASFSHPAAGRIPVPQASGRFIHFERFANTFRYARPFYWYSTCSEFLSEILKRNER